MKVGEFLGAALENVWLIFIMGYGLSYLAIGSMGIEHYWGNIASIIFIILAIFLRFTLPITIGAFFGAVDVLHWHWALAILFVAPGLAFIIPGAIGFLITTLVDKFRANNK